MVLNPTEEFWNHVPPTVQRAIQSLGFGAMRLAGLRPIGFNWEHDPIYLGQALAIALREGNHRLVRRGAYSSGPAPIRIKEMRDWVREMMGYCVTERVFPELRSVFEHSVAMNSTEEIHRRLDDLLHPRQKRGLEQALADFRRQTGASVDSPEEMWALGIFLGNVRETDSSDLLQFAFREGMLSTGDFPALETRAAAELLRSQMSGMPPPRGIGIQLPVEADFRLARTRRVQGLIESMREQYGDAHPVVRGYEEHISARGMDGEFRWALERFYQEFEQFLTNRH